MPGTFNEQAERSEFEAATYAFYLRKRAARLAEGKPPVFLDHGDEPAAATNMFQRHENGEYITIIYQAAWSGWKMAREGV